MENQVTNVDVKAMNIYQKLAAVQQELAVPKGNVNTFGNYNYRNCEDILQALKPILKKYGALVVLKDSVVIIENARAQNTENYRETYAPNPKTGQIQVQEKIVTDSKTTVFNAFYVKATATFIDIKTGETFSTDAIALHPLAKKGMDDSQLSGATTSYARKYALNAMFCIDDCKDADNPEFSGKTNPAYNNQPAKGKGYNQNYANKNQPKGSASPF